jgi:hypothetical protein
MKEKEESREIHCREVREIMEKKPGWIIRWGTMIISLLLLAAVILSWKYFI